MSDNTTAETPPKGPEMREVAISGGRKDITKGYTDENSLELPPHELIHVETPEGHTICDSTLSDPQVWAALEQRRLQVVSAEWEVVPGGDSPVDQDAADFIREQLINIRWDAVRGMMHYAVFYGYSIAEVMWARTDNRVVIHDIRVRDRRRFQFTVRGEPRLITFDNPQGEELADAKFWWYRSAGTHSDQPYGMGLAWQLHWLVHFKKHMTKYWLIHLEKYGSPTSVGTFPVEWIDIKTGGLNAAALNFLDAVKSSGTDAALIIPESTSIELLNIARSGGSTHGEFLAAANKMIAKIILGQTLTIDDDGGQYKAEVHKKILDAIIKADADDMYSSFNESVVKWLMDWNFPGASYPKVWANLDEPEDLRLLAERDKLLSEIGYSPTPERVLETYGDGYELRIPASQPRPQLPPSVTTDPAFAELQVNLTRDEAAFETALETLGAASFGNDAREILEPVINTVRRLGPEKARTQIQSLYPDMNTAQFESMMTRWLFVADTWGRLSAENG